jgi:hypothetical protein
MYIVLAMETRHTATESDTRITLYFHVIGITKIIYMSYKDSLSDVHRSVEGYIKYVKFIIHCVKIREQYHQTTEAEETV